jgi:GNAT superfamily N-acetyltransferase
MLFSIQAARESDLELIQQLAWEIWPVWYGSIISPCQIEYMLRLLYTPDALARKEKEGERFFLVRRGLRACGFLGLETQKKDTRLTKLYLTEVCRGKGIGREMIGFSLEKARENKSRHLILNVNRFNPSLGFYLRQGFGIREQADIPFGPFWLNDFILEKPPEQAPKS